MILLSLCHTGEEIYHWCIEDYFIRNLSNVREIYTYTRRNLRRNNTTC